MSSADTDDEIIATAMLLGARFERSAAPRALGGTAPGFWRYITSEHSSAGWYITKTDAAKGFLCSEGFLLDFNSNIQEIA